MNLNINELAGSSAADEEPKPDEGSSAEGTPSVEEIAGTEQTKLISDEVQALLTAQIGHEMFAH